MNSIEYAYANANVNPNTIYNNCNSFNISNKINNDQGFGQPSVIEKNRLVFKMRRPENVRSCFESQIQLI